LKVSIFNTSSQTRKLRLSEDRNLPVRSQREFPSTKREILSWVWRSVPVIPALGRWRQEDLECEVSLGYIHFKKKKERARGRGREGERERERERIFVV
jgi:hypothetical protein